MANFQPPERPEDRDDEERIERMLRAGEISLEAQLAQLTTPVADDRFILPSPVRRSLFNEMLDEIARRYAGNELIESLTTQTRNASKDLHSLLQDFNKGNGVGCLEGFHTFARRVEEVETQEIGGLPTLDAFLTEKLIEELLPDLRSPRSKVLRELIDARSQYLSLAIGVLVDGDSLHARMAIMAQALDRIITAIEAPPSRLEQESTRERATQNIQTFIEDLKLPGTTQSPTGECVSGRYEFELKLGPHACIVSMPGMPIDELRPLAAGATDESGPIRYRLWVDGSSWLWEFALDVTRDALEGRLEE